MPQPDQTLLAPECGDIDGEGNAASGRERETRTMVIDGEGPLAQEGSPSDSRSLYEPPSANYVDSNRGHSRNGVPIRSHDSGEGTTTFNTQADKRGPSPSIMFILSKMNLRVVSIPSPDQGRLLHRFMVCITCQMGLDPNNAVHHATSKEQAHFGHGIKIFLHERTLVREWIASALDLHSIHNPPPIPAAHSPPIPGLKVLKGHKCPTCGECKESEGMMKRHSTLTGHRKPRAAFVQFFFSTREKNYFVVQPGRQVTTIGHTEKDVDMYTLYAGLFGLDIEVKLPFYHDDKEMPQLLQITRWFDHVWPYLRLREDDVEEDGDESSDGLSEAEEGSDAGGEDTRDEVSSDADGGHEETTAGTKRKRSRPNAHLTVTQPPPLKRRKGTTGSDMAAWSRGGMKVNNADYFSSDDDPMAESDEEDRADNAEDEDDGGKEDGDEDEGEGDDYDFVQLKNRRKIDKKEQRRWSKWDTLTSVSKAKTLVSVRQPGLSLEEKAHWYGTRLRDTISCYATSIGKEIRSSSSGFEIRRILGG